MHNVAETPLLQIKKSGPLHISRNRAYADLSAPPAKPRHPCQTSNPGAAWGLTRAEDSWGEGDGAKECHSRSLKPSGASEDGYQWA